MVQGRRIELAGRSALVIFIVIMFAQPSTFGQDQKKPDLTQVPKVVMDALKAKFPNAEIVK